VNQGDYMAEEEARPPITVSQFARMLRISQDAALTALRSAGIAVFKKGHRLVVAAEDVALFLGGRSR